MRDSALKLARSRHALAILSRVGEELMRDSALKPAGNAAPGLLPGGRRRAHARQRFETKDGMRLMSFTQSVGEELMRDSALKHRRHCDLHLVREVGEELMRDSALKLFY